MTAGTMGSTTRTRNLALVITTLILAIACLGFANVNQAYAQISHVYVNKEDIVKDGTVECTQGSASYDSATKTLFLNDAFIDQNRGFSNINIIGNKNDTLHVVINGANKIDYAGSGFGTGIDSDASLVFDGAGSLTIDNTYKGIVSDSNITIVNDEFIIDARHSAFSCDRFTITGGKLTSVSGGTNAVSAKRMTNDPSHLGYINGKLAIGAKFVKSKNSYTVSSNKGVTLTKYGNSKTTCTVNTVAYGYTYNVETVGASAFAKTKVKKVTLGKNVTSVKKNAFNKTKSLTSLVIKNSSIWNTGSKGFASKSLSSAGKSSGKKLTVKVDTTTAANTVKSKLRSAGLSKKAKVKTNSKRVSTASTSLTAASVTL